ncbi:MAG TPA: methionine adenosyltransferase [Bacillota bacterium]|jgi:S-adenosylmethionine synthetase|nr:methionine adenosyltransferase [Fastidiosipila sp.]HPX93404.1 methionine adenosyltransferase [Bacillota bacterium]HQB81176.1 methionine adenosyltransferase [Bacillota bacterium]
MFNSTNDSWLFTSESVTEGHPDKVCDQIADAVLDTLIGHDPCARVACETVVTTGLVLVLGEITTSAYADIPLIARETLRRIGYADNQTGFDASSCAVLTSIDEQSADIAMGVNCSLEARENGDHDTGAGDQGMMFGFANSDTPEYMPLPITLAHRLTKRLAEARKSGHAPSLYPDGKSQVTIHYEGERPVHIDTVVISSQHRDDVPSEQVREEIEDAVIYPVLAGDLFDSKTRILINPTGRFVIGGPQGDTGLTGRKIICDTYGGFGHHGGGAFSGKDPTKVDRTGSYAARYIAKNLVAAGFCSQCEVQIAYVIGVAQPVSVTVTTFGTGRGHSDQELSALVRRSFDLRPDALIERFDMLRPIYAQVSNYGHFGRPDLDLPWERLDALEQLLSN